MSEFRVPSREQAAILKENGIEPDSVAVMNAGEGWMQLLVYRTRCILRLERGDKPWQ